MKQTKSFKILVYVGLDLLGDGLMKLSFLRALRGTYPKAQIIWFAGKGKSVFSGVLSPTSKGLIDDVVDTISYGSSLKDLIKPLPFRESFDIIIDTQTRIKTTLLLKRIPHKIFISRAANFFFSNKKPDKTKQSSRHLQERLLDLVRVLNDTTRIDLVKAPLYLSSEDEKIAQKLLPKLKEGNFYVGLVPGAGGRQKCWPLGNYVKLAHWLREKGHVPVFILGPQERDWVSELQEKVPFARFPLQEKEVVGNNPSLFLSMALGKRLKGAVTNDCGTGHLLAAVDTPLVSLFGPTNAEKFSPYTPHLILLKAQDFSPSGNTEMDLIPLDAVQNGLFTLLLS